jgi:hypothetical protein
VDIDTFVPVSSSIFTRPFAVVLGLICTFLLFSVVVATDYKDISFKHFF